MEAVNILAVVNGHDDLLLVNMFGQRQLHDEAVDVGIIVELSHTTEKFLLRDIIFVADQF